QAHAAGIRIGSGSNSQHRLEFSLQMKWAQVESASQPRQCQGLIEILFDVTANGLHRFRLSVPRKSFRTATQASAIACALGLFRMAKKGDVLPPRPFRRARRPAVDPGGRARED